MTRRPLAGAAVLVLVAGAARAQPWLEGPVPRAVVEAKSVRVLGPNEPLYLAPTMDSARRGAALEGARLPIYAARSGPGCEGAWLMVGAIAWVCSARVELSPWAPGPANIPPRRERDGLPFRYHFVGEYGALGYQDLVTAETGPPDAQLEPGFAVALMETRERFPGDVFGLTTKGLWLPMRDVRPAQPFLFRGKDLSGTLDVGWVYEATARVFASPGGRRLDEELPQFAAVTILERRSALGRAWFRVGDEAWLDERDLRVPTPPSPLPSILPDERWIDIDRKRQTLTAYEGERPVFATLVSTGRGREGTDQSTPAGDHRIWIKLVTSDMDNLESESAEHLYAIQDVPWVMYFDRAYGLHGTFWHRSFGRTRSHGCVNLAPLDARHLFDWTHPRLPAGWSAVLPTPYDRGTLVHIR
ncbi:MAG: L,D-transpeptidase [Polyangiaceae bacterium]|nr:L,D-transpeptidase [Polyangiaceae bacterium]